MDDTTIHQALETAEAHHRAGELPQAEAIYRQVLSLHPNDADALHLLGVLAVQVGHGDAIPLLRKAIAQRPRFPEAYGHLGDALQARGEIVEAITCYRRAVELLADFPEAWINLGHALVAAGEIDEAVNCCRRAVSLRPGVPEAHNSLGDVLRSKGMTDEAISEFRAAIALDPNFAEAHGNLSHALLQRGDLEEGYREYEWRWRCETFRNRRRQFAQPQWDGSELRGKTILLHAEQGFGDTLQMLRFVPAVVEKVGQVIVECPEPLMRLAHSAAQSSRMKVVGGTVDADENFDVHLPMMSLPFALKLRSETDIARRVPYLAAEPRELKEAGMRVGLAWSGSTAHARDRNRSIALRQLAPLARGRHVLQSAAWRGGCRNGQGAARVEADRHERSDSGFCRYRADRCLARSGDLRGHGHRTFGGSDRKTRVGAAGIGGGFSMDGASGGFAVVSDDAVVPPEATGGLEAGDQYSW